MSTKVLREQRAGVVGLANGILTAAQRERRNLTAEELQRFNALHAEAVRLKGNIDEQEFLAPAHKRSDAPGSLAFRTWFVDDTIAAKPSGGVVAANLLQFRTRVPQVDVALPSKAPRSPAEARAITTTTVSSGQAVMVDSGFIAGVEAAQLAYSPVRRFATVARTESGGDAFVPTVDDTGVEGEIIRDGGTLSEGDSTFGLKRLGAYHYSSKIVRVSFAAFQDSGIDMEFFLGRQLGERLARVQGRHFTVGSGANEPQGVLTAATSSGVTTASASAITYGELLALKCSVDPAHRDKAVFMAHDSTVKSLKQMVDTAGRPIFAVGLEVGAPDTLDGDELVINQNMPTISASAKPVLYGDLSKYLVREVANLTLVKIVERWAELGQIGFQLSSRVDAVLLDAGSHPVRYLSMHS